MTPLIRTWSPYPLLSGANRALQDLLTISSARRALAADDDPAGVGLPVPGAVACPDADDRLRALALGEEAGQAFPGRLRQGEGERALRGRAGGSRSPSAARMMALLPRIMIAPWASARTARCSATRSRIPSAGARAASPRARMAGARRDAVGGRRATTASPMRLTVPRGPPSSRCACLRAGRRSECRPPRPRRRSTAPPGAAASPGRSAGPVRSNCVGAWASSLAGDRPERRVRERAARRSRRRRTEPDAARPLFSAQGAPTSTSGRPSPLTSPPREADGPRSRQRLRRCGSRPFRAPPDRPASSSPSRRRRRRSPTRRGRCCRRTALHEHVRAPVAVHVPDARDGRAGDVARRQHRRSGNHRRRASPGRHSSVDVLPKTTYAEPDLGAAVVAGVRRADEMSGRPSPFTSPAPETASPARSPRPPRRSGSRPSPSDTRSTGVVDAFPKTTYAEPDGDGRCCSRRKRRRSRPRARRRSRRRPRRPRARRCRTRPLRRSGSRRCRARAGRPSSSSVFPKTTYAEPECDSVVARELRRRRGRPRDRRR